MISAGGKAARPAFDREEVLRAARAIFKRGMVTELRALNATIGNDRYTGTISGYFDNAEALADAAAEITSAKGVYFVPNEVRPDLLARSVNKARQVKSEALTSDKDILRRRWLLIDCDALRPADISAS